MEEIKVKEAKDIKNTGKEPAPEYISPKVVTYTSDEILEQIGPAMACSPTPCPTSP
ncbi:MAG: hypothetical protein U9N38_02960 [Thermodesulfobacteriota bacterium]|nr:hypothetical protein [Thermodesulfobacteriota bacterium]